MKKVIYLALLGILYPFFPFAQISNPYRDMIKKAEALFANKQFQESADMYLAAFHSGSKMVFVSDLYNSAWPMAQVGMFDSAFYRLNMIAGTGGLTDYDYLIKDSNLVLLHKDARWDVLCRKVKQNKDNKDKAEAMLNKPLVAILDTIYADDQGLRKQIDSTTKNFGQASKEMRDLGAAMRAQDSINVLKMEKILQQYGWLGSDVIGSQGSRTLFLVIQHAKIETQEKYLPMMREAVKNGKANASNLALLEDRIALRQGRKQIYGSQIATTKDGETYIQPLDDPDNVDKRRAAVGLGSLADYVQHWNLKWDPEAYKKQLPDIERKQKETFDK